ncbi:phage virion morphogenesis protein [Vallitalea guaymasensis]|uniref:phage virion morphogenesis protein n=1 Tax=Vallitalea guaymasensis TaxID=1185412 RepID=UPI000DE4011C|nr:phage virion morphogenesis protein [Vallitalea guaymasensis]
MAGVSIRTKGDYDNLKMTIKHLENIAYADVNELIGEILLSSTDERFKRSESPEGKKWKKSIRVKNHGGKTLIQKGNLRSIYKKVSEEGVAIGTNKKYARIHQKGGIIKIRSRRVRIKMPKRPFLGISTEDEAEIKATLQEVMKEYVT